MKAKLVSVMLMIVVLLLSATQAFAKGCPPEPGREQPGTGNGAQEQNDQEPLRPHCPECTEPGNDPQPDPPTSNPGNDPAPTNNPTPPDDPTNDPGGDPISDPNNGPAPSTDNQLAFVLYMPVVSGQAKPAPATPRLNRKSHSEF